MTTIDLDKVDANNISRLHGQLWESFISAFKKDCGFSPTFISLPFVVDNGLVVLEKKNSPVIKISKWPRRYNTTTHRSKQYLDIFMRFHFSIEGLTNGRDKQIRVKSSSIDVVYTEHEPKSDVEHIPIIFMHYDTHQGKNGHPIFHTHIAEDVIDWIPNLSSNPRKVGLDELRIATPPMDFRAILIGLVNDHYFHGLKGLLKIGEWNNLEGRLPLMPCGHIRDQQNGRMKNIHWYP